MRMLPLLFALACGVPADPGTPPIDDTDPTVTDTEVEAPLPPFAPAPATLHRLTARQLRATWQDVFGVNVTVELPADYVLHGYAAVGGSEATLPPADLERLEVAAWSVATQLVRDATSRDAVVGCALDVPAWDQGEDRARHCVRTWLAELLPVAWRRPVTEAEVDALADLFESVVAESDRTLGVQAVIAAIAQSPHLVFRVEVGEPDPAVGGRRYTAWELAGRLAFFLTDAPPDAELRASAADGTLHEPAVLAAHASRLYNTPRAREALTAFFAESFELHELTTVEKDPEVFPQMTPALRASMREELERLFQAIVLDGDSSWAQLLVTNETFVDANLAPLYGLRTPEEGWERVQLPPDQARGGLLGRVGMLALHAHATQTSPTHRGKFVRTRLLCGSILPPPPGVVASLEAIEGGGTLRQRLERHVSDPQCANCHDAMDPIGFAFEGFDALGRHRIEDVGQPVDTTGTLDGVPFTGAQELGFALANHEALAECLTLQLYRHALGRAEQDHELIAIREIASTMVAGGGRLEPLVTALVSHPAFRTAQAPTAVCSKEESGLTRACDNACGAGTETCTEGFWSGCSAPLAPAETCDGRDEDCDGTTDHLVTPCAEGAGLEVCVDGAAEVCQLPLPAVEVCNGLDDDGSGAADDLAPVAATSVSFSTLRALRPACDAELAPTSVHCASAAHHACREGGCNSAGLGVVARDLETGHARVPCLDAATAVPRDVSWADLALQHDGCSGPGSAAPPCNAAIHRWCASQGLTSGFGPVDQSDSTAGVVCTPGASVRHASYAVLTTLVSGCDGAAERQGPSCHVAFDAWCRSEGFATGFGPVENSGDLAVTACLGAL